MYCGGDRGGHRGRNNDNHHDGGRCMGNSDDEMANRVEVHALHYPSVECHHPVVQGGWGQHVQRGRWD